MAVFESTRIVVDQYLNKENMKRKENFLYAGIKKLIKYCLILGKKIGEKNFIFNIYLSQKKYFTSNEGEIALLKCLKIKYLFIITN